MKKADVNYLVDCAILAAFLLSAISGVIFLAPLGWLDLEAPAGPAFLGIRLASWNDLHTYASLAMVAGVALHLVLHWTWIITMTKRALRKKEVRQ